MSYENSLFDFIEKSKTPYHTVETVKDALLSAGFDEIDEGDFARASDGGRHFVIRSDSSIIAFKGRLGVGGFMISATHSDTPTFKVKATDTDGTYARLTVEGYGGMINHTWLDRPLSVAGRVVIRDEDKLSVRLVSIDRDLVTIPSVAIHLNRSVNDGVKLNHAVDMLPLIGISGEVSLRELLAEEISVDSEKIVDYDLYLYNRMKPTVIGSKGDVVLSPRIDDLASVYACLQGFLKSDAREGVSVLCVFDNEEVGSSTKQGAASTFLEDTLIAVAGGRREYKRALISSFMVSCDNAHARHPNHPELSDPKSSPVLGGGVVVKYNANQRYATDSVSASIFKTAAALCGEKTQEYHNRADMPGGSTLGSISNTKVSVSTVDVGLPQLAMHSSCECCASSDVASLVNIMTELYSSYILKNKKDIQIKK